jgi:hypothetical protein
MKKLWVLLTVFLLLTVSLPVFAELELGVGFSPPLGSKDQNAGMSGNVVQDAMYSSHLGLSWWWLFYASVDSYVMPPYTIQDLTTTVNETTGTVTPGYYRPGFLNLFDVGIRPELSSVILMLETGINYLYIWRSADVPDLANKSMLGVNLRGGVGYNFGFISAMVSGTVVFDNFQDVVTVFRNIAGNNQFLRDQTLKGLLKSLYPTLTVNLHF